MAKLLLINGPNLNLLGTREPEIYGHHSLGDIEQMLQEQARKEGHALECIQSNHEGALVDAIHQAWQQNVAGILINPGAYTHTSVAIRDALAGTRIPFIEIHLSNTHAREDFRQLSYLSPLASGVIMGLGVTGYRLGLQAMIETLQADA
ncbi:MAG: type II 3-dehydroquinate dehydratase [Litorivicinus sp.]